MKSPVSLVHEKALKRGLPVSFEVVSEIGKPHIRTFRTKCTVGDKVTLGEGPSKKVSINIIFFFFNLILSFFYIRHIKLNIYDLICRYQRNMQLNSC